MRLVTLMLAALLAVQGVIADSRDCLADGDTCAFTTGCPKVCCSGLPSRTSGSSMYCPSRDAVLRGDAPSNNTTTTSPTTPASTIGTAISSSSTTNETPSPTEGDDATTNGSSVSETPTPTPIDTFPPPVPVATEETQSPSAAGKTSSVDAFQNTDTISNSRGGSGGGAANGIFIAVGALAGCVVLVVAVMYKRKTTTTQALEVPGSSYQGTNGSGLTPDNRSLDGMMDGGARGSTESMKQLPVLSMAGRDGSSVARISSPFGQGVARISSPAHRGGTNEDYAFDVDMGSRPGSSVQVAFVDAGHTDPQTTEFVGDKPANGVVAL